jgi:oligoribonuclease NrnB/cAMP/cGMP phosphodiesterase (DHH superfamily)
MSFTIEYILSRKIFVVHDSCPDDLSAGLILNHALPGREIIFVQHGTSEYLNLEARPGMLFCDISPPPNRIKEFIDVDTGVLDHHKSVENVVRQFPHHVFADEKLDPGVSGGTLAYSEILQPLIRAGFAQYSEIASYIGNLAGVRDTWQKNSKDWIEACNLADALMFWPRETLLNTELDCIDSWNNFINIGPIVREKKLKEAKNLVDKSFTFELNNKKIMLVSGSKIEDCTEFLDSSYDLLIGFSFLAENNQQKMLLSLRSNNKFDCAKFAKSLGGGGHTNAAGCIINLYNDDIQPYELIKYILRNI